MSLPTLPNNDNSETKTHWWSFGPSTWTLIGGLLLLNVAVFIGSTILDPALDAFGRIIDFRLWPWWYFIVLLLIVAFSIKWYRIVQDWPEFDPHDRETESRFLRMSIVLSVEGLLLVILNATSVLSLLYVPFGQWIRLGVYSHTAGIAFLIPCLAGALTFYVVREWLIYAIKS